jgi:hypothetical protein
MKMTDAQKKERALKKAHTKLEELKLAEKERIENNFKRNVIELQRKNSHALSKPNFKYEVGETIPVYANWDNCVVLEVLDDGGIYKVEETVKKTNQKAIHYVSFLDIYPKGKTQSSVSLHDEDNTLGVQFYNQDFSSLKHYHYRGINYSPSYQRGLVWNQSDKEKLIDSLMNGIEVGKFVLIELPFDHSKTYGGDHYEILDGKQRLTTLIQFFENQFTYKGKLFCELSIKDQNYLNRRMFSVAIGKEDEWPLERKLKYFLKLNTGGVPQSMEHLKSVETQLEKIKNESK